MSDGLEDVVAVGEARGERPHGLDRRAVEEAGVQGRDLCKDLGAGRAQGRPDLGRQVLEKALEQQLHQVLEARAAGQFVQGAPAYDQMPGLAVHLREHGVRGDDVFQTIRHGRSPVLACWPSEMPASYRRQS